MGTEDSVNSAYAAAQKYVDEDKGWSFEPTDDEVKCVLEVIKNVRQHTRDYFYSILNNQSAGIFQAEKGRPFNRNPLFTTNTAGIITKIYKSDWLKEVKWCNPAIWTAADNDPEVGDLNAYITAFKKEWIDFFKALYDRFPDHAAEPISDFETAGLEMFGGLESSVICAKANTPNADTNHDCFIGLLPEIKKLFLSEQPAKSIRASEPTFESIVAKLRQSDKDNIARQWLEIRDVLQRYGLSIPLQQWETPTGWKSDNVDVAFGTLREKIESSIRLISKPEDNCFNGHEWEFLIPPILSFDLSQIWYTVPETLDDGFYHSEKLPSGDVINVSRISDNSYLGYQPLDMSIYGLERYIRLGNDIATQIDSSSKRNWVKADAIFKEVRFQIPYSNSREKLEKLAGLLSEAKRDLLVDEKIYAEQNNATHQPKPKTIGEVPVEDFWSRFNKEKNKAKIGKPSADDHAANGYTQPQIAAMFGPPCNDDKVANWESKARGSDRGAVPPSAMYKGRLESYREELRKFPIGENVEILAAIIEQYKATEGVKAAVGEKAKIVHARSEETSYRMQHPDGRVRTQNRGD